MGYKIGSFNLKNIGLTALGNKNERDLKKIAEIIKREKFDVVALQEVLSEGKAFTSSYGTKKSILMELGRDWGFEWADSETSLADSRQECYAFFWNKRRLRMSTTILSDNTDRIEVERAFSLYKCCYGMGLITTKLEETKLTSIALSVFVSNLFKMQRQILFALLYMFQKRNIYEELKLSMPA